MSEPFPPAVSTGGPPLEYATPGGVPPARGRPVLLRSGGALGVAACAAGILIMLAACGGSTAALWGSFVPVLLGGIGFLITILGAVLEKRKYADEDTHVLAALFACTMGIIGGVVEMAAHHKWPVFS